jgi:hypothetical protein
VVATIIVVVALGAVSEIVLPLTFAAVLAVIFKPLVGIRAPLWVDAGVTDAARGGSAMVCGRFTRARHRQG